jgi:hypothetical protein
VPFKFKSKIQSNKFAMSTFCGDVRDLDLENILERFDASVKGKFDRCANSDWCSEEIACSSCMKDTICNKSSRRRNSMFRVCRKFKFARKVASKLESMKVKLLQLKSPRRVEMVYSDMERTIDEQIRQGSNTPANSRPCSISMTMDNLDNFRGKLAEQVLDGHNSCSISCGGS